MTCKPCTWCTCVQPSAAEILEEPIPGPTVRLDNYEPNARTQPREGINPMYVPSPPPMQIISAVKEKDVEYMDHTPEDDRALGGHPFECPICFRFGDHILKTRCCRQYICHSCALRLRLGFAKSSCPHCRQQPLILIDPQPDSPVKCYRDSPGFNLRLLRIAHPGQAGAPSLSVRSSPPPARSPPPNRQAMSARRSPPPRATRDWSALELPLERTPWHRTGSTQM